MSLPDIAIAAGIVIGAVMILAVCVGYVKRSTFGTAGAVLSVLGVLLVGMSVWSRATIEVTPDGLKVEVERLERQIAAVRERTQEVSRELVDIAANTETSREQILRLSEQLQATQTLDPGTAEQIQMMLHGAPVIEMGRIQALGKPIPAHGGTREDSPHW